MANNTPLKSGKIVKIVWFVSNCHSASRREDFVAELGREENVQIDIFGSGGNLKCDKTAQEVCFLKHLPNYDFYLSLENEICQDYFTEKLCETLKYDIVPIVLGGADYKRFAPPHSVVNVADFSNVNELSKYLRLLKDNQSEYKKYFAWKRTYVIERRIQPIFACDICSKLNRPDLVEKTKFSDWWNHRKCLNSWKDLVKR